MFANQSTRKVWKTIKLGIGVKEADIFRKALRDAHMWLGDWADTILSEHQFTLASEPTEVNLVVVSVAELGFKDRPKLRDIYVAAKDRGLELCPAEVGPQLRLHYVDQPIGECLIIGMEPISGSDGCLKLFYVDRTSHGRWLHGYWCRLDICWLADDRFVFVLPSK